MNSRPVRIEIEQIVFEGLNPAEARTATAAFGAELQRLIATRGVPAALRVSGDRPLMQLDASWTPTSHPSEIGRGLARGIVDGGDR